MVLIKYIIHCIAVVCPSAPEKPRGGKWFWSNTNKNGTFGTTIDYECGPYAKFQTPNTTNFYEKITSMCQWNKTWTKSKLDPCICNITFSLPRFFLKQRLYFKQFLNQINGMFLKSYFNVTSTFFTGTHCTVIPEPLDLTKMVFLPTPETEHLLILTDTSSYAPQLPDAISVHEKFGTEKHFEIDGLVK